MTVTGLAVAFTRNEWLWFGYRTRLGLLNLSREYGDARLENACQQALLLVRPWRQVILNLLTNHRDRLKDEAPDESPVEHSNVRGAGYYH